MKKDDVIKTFTLLQTDENTKKIFDADISARIPYRLHCCVYNFDREVWVEDDILYNYDLGGNCQTLKILNERGACLMYYQIRPYLRPMSSMTEEEKRELQSFFPGSFGSQWLDIEKETIEIFECPSTMTLYLNDSKRVIDFFNSHHIDYLGFIEDRLALDAPEDMYKTE